MTFERLIICSNTLIGGGQLLTINGFAPLIIENGFGIPIVTINSSTQIGSAPPIWNTYVLQNRTNHPAVRIEIDPQHHRVSVRALNTVVLDARVVDHSTCIVGALDFRPIGLDIFGDANSLVVSGNSYSQNTIQASFMLSLNAPNPYAMQ